MTTAKMLGALFDVVTVHFYKVKVAFALTTKCGIQRDRKYYVYNSVIP